MWKQMARIIGEVQPKFVFVENSPMLTSRGLGTVLGDLAEMGLDAEWGVLSAADVGANHLRERIWILAYSKHFGRVETKKNRTDYGIQPKSSTRQKLCINELERTSSLWKTTDMAKSQSERLQRRNDSRNNEQNQPRFGKSCWSIKDNWLIEPNVGRVANGLAARVDRLKAIGNGQVPLCAATAWEMLRKRLDE
jgi:DNA (cytosine-5)-methyltransferase 1